MRRTFFALALALAVRSASAQEAATPPCLDGRMTEWADGIAAIPASDYLWLRLSLPEPFTLQGGDRTTRIALDLDAKATTGQRRGDGDAALGVDLEILLNPPSEGAKKGVKPGLELRAYDDAGVYDRVGHSIVEFALAPSFAARDFEFRIARQTRLKEPAGSRFRASTRLRAAIDVLDAKGQVAFEGTRCDVALPPLAAPARYSGALPSKPEGALRVVSWNVHWEEPTRNPAPFARVLAALAPDVIHLQEWKTSEKDLVAWFSANLPSPEPWRAHTYQDLGTSIVTRLPLAPLTLERLLPKRAVDGKERRAIRFVAARIETPLGALVSGSMHLKCCGHKDSVEDRQRLAETETIQSFVKSALANAPDSLVLLTGDMNLVGTREPLVNLMSGLDADGSDLASAEPETLGAAACYTWSDADSPFSPGRLDYALYPDAALEVAQSFVLDGARLAPECAQAAGMTPDDFKASDHRPLVVDLKGKPAPTASAASAAPKIVAKSASDLLALARDGSAEVTLVNLWASTCIPCVQEMPHLLRLRRELGREKLRLVFVTCDFEEDLGAAAKILSRLGVDFETYARSGTEQEFISGIDPGWEGTLPFTLVFDRRGEKRLVHQGARSYEEFARDVSAAGASSGS